MGGKTRRVEAERKEIVGTDEHPERRNERVRHIVATLALTWPDAEIELDFENAYQLTVATILAAQNTDANVNKVTPALFKRYPDARALAAAVPAELEPMIFSTGFFRQKTKSLIAMAQTALELFDGEIPRTLEEITKLRGVARKTGNVVLGAAYGVASGIVVDTHVKRVSQRLGLTAQIDPVKIERELTAMIPQESWISFSHQLILHGRRICEARKPRCNDCSLAPH